MKNIRKLLPVALCALFAAPSPAQDAPRQQLKGHVTPEMTNTLLAGRVPPTTQMTLTIGLVIPNSSALIDAAAQIADPNSPFFRKYLTPEQVADQFGAKAADYQSVLDWARSNNLTATAHRNRFVVTVDGSVADIESALNIHLNDRVRADGTEFFAPDAEPSLKLSVPVEHIGGTRELCAPSEGGWLRSVRHLPGNRLPQRLCAQHDAHRRPPECRHLHARPDRRLCSERHRRLRHAYRTDLPSRSGSAGPIPR